jgi:hypothetical protein
MTCTSKTVGGSLWTSLGVKNSMWIQLHAAYHTFLRFTIRSSQWTSEKKSPQFFSRGRGKVTIEICRSISSSQGLCPRKNILPEAKLLFCFVLFCFYQSLTYYRTPVHSRFPQWGRDTSNSSTV